MSRYMNKRVGGMLLAAAVALAPISAFAASEADEYYQAAQKHLAKKEGRAAVIQLKNALQQDPGHTESRLLLGSIYLTLGDGPAAEKEFGRAGQLGAEAKRWLLGYGQALLVQKKHEEVLKSLLPDESLDTETRASVLAMRAQAHLARGEKDKGVEAYEQAVALSPNNVLVRLGRVRMLIQDRDYEKALEDAKQLVKVNPDNVEGWLSKAELHRQLKQLDEAEAGFKKAIELQARNQRAHIGLGLVHVAQNKPDEALKDVERMRKLFKNIPFGSYVHALAAYQKKDLDTAAEQLQLVLRDIPNQLQAQLLYGMVNYAQGKYQLAQDYLTRINSSMPDEPTVAKLLAASHLKLKDPDRAISVLERLAPNHPKDTQLMALLGTAHMQSGNNNKGAEYLGQAVELSPDQALLRTQLAVGQLVSGDTPSAIAELEQAVNLGQDMLQADILLVLSYLKAGEFKKAQDVSRRLGERMPDSPIPPNMLGLAYMASKEYDKSRAALNQALQKDGNFLTAEMNLARLAIAEGNNERAARHYETVLKKDTRHLQAMLGLAALAQRAKDAAGMRKWVTRAYEANPTALQPALMLSEMMLRDKEPLKVIGMLNELPEEAKEVPQVLRMRGMAQIQAGQYSNAARSLRLLTERQPEYLEGWFQLGRAQTASGDYTSARASFKRALELDTEHKVPLLLMALGELELKTQRWDDALLVASRMQKYHPKNPASYELEAAALRGQGKIKKALDALEKAVRAESTSQRVNLFAHTLAASGQSPKAVYLLEDWLRDNPKDQTARSTLGLLLQQMGKVDEAIASYEKVLESGEPNPVVFNNLAWLYLKKGDPKAEEFARKAYDLAPERPEIVDTYGWVLFERGKHAEGLGLLQQALVLAPRNPEIGMHVAEALHRSGRDDEARPLLERVIKDHPNTQWTVPAKELLIKLKK